MCDSSRSRSRTSSPRPAIGASASLSGRSRNTCSISSSIEAESSASASKLGSSGAKIGSAGSRAERVVQCRRHLAEPARRAGSQPGSVASVSSASVQPSPRERHEALQDRERRLDRMALEPGLALERGDVLKAAVGEEAEQLELRVRARLEPAVELERRAARRGRRSCSTARRPSARTRPRSPSSPWPPAAWKRSTPRAAQGRLAAHQPDELAHELRVGDRVVDRPAVCPRRHASVQPSSAGRKPSASW